MNIAADRHMTTTAEGVETEQQRDLLRELGCSEMQGYLFSPPKPAADDQADCCSAHREAPDAARHEPGAPSASRLCGRRRVFVRRRLLPSLRAKRSNPSHLAKKEWIASSLSLPCANALRLS